MDDDQIVSDEMIGKLIARQMFAVDILNGLLAHHGSPLPRPTYLMELPREPEEARKYMQEKDEYLRRVEEHNRRTICRQAVKLADELIRQLNASE